jgi:hypothetical protein
MSPDMETVKLELTCNDDVFFEALAGCVKNSVFSHQARVYKNKNARKNRLTGLITNLKRNFNDN